MTTSIQPTDPSNEPPQRLLPDRAFPPYTYVPGSDTPHPTGDPRGHSYGLHEPACDPPDPGNWRTCERFQWGVDLFNAGYYWESHEAWEAVWIAAGRRGPTADFLKALIKLAAAGVKLRENNAAGARRHLRRAEQLFDGVGASPEKRTGRILGLSLNALRSAAQRLQSGALQNGLPKCGQPSRVLEIRLKPE